MPTTNKTYARPLISFDQFRMNVHNRMADWDDESQLAEEYIELLYELVKLRVKANISEKTMGIRMKTAQTNIAKFEAGHQLPSIFWIKRWCDILGYELHVSIKKKKVP